MFSLPENVTKKVGVPNSLIIAERFLKSGDENLVLEDFVDLCIRCVFSISQQIVFCRQHHLLKLKPYKFLLQFLHILLKIKKEEITLLF